MNSIHDIGGMHGIGELPFEDNEPLWHGDWEAKTFGVHILTLMTGFYTADETRHSMERIPALHWLGAPYYEHWLDGTEMLLIEKGLATAEELKAGHARHPLPEWAQALTPIAAEDVPSVATTNHPVTGDLPEPPRFAVGDKVRTRNINPRSHTRLPRYTRGKVGTVAAYYAACLYADGRAQGDMAALSHTYSIRFEGTELWGPDAGVKDALYIDLYETYLEQA